jgi:hypothetical protein
LEKYLQVNGRGLNEVLPGNMSGNHKKAQVSRASVTAGHLDNRRFISGNACYNSFQDDFSSRPLSKNRKIRIYKTIILPVVCMGLKLGF